MPGRADALGEGGGFAWYVGGRRFYPVMVAEKRGCQTRAVFRGPGGHGSRPLRGGAMARLGRAVGDPAAGGGTKGSTDMGNVSYLVPSIHPLVALAPTGVKIHEVEFAAAAASEAADRAVIDGAKAMAMTVVDYWMDSSLRDVARAEFDS